MRYKKLTAILLTSFLILGACSGHDDHEKVNKNDDEKLPPIPKKVFVDQQSNKQLSEKELKNSIKTYLNTNKDLADNITDLGSETKLNKKDKKKLNKLQHMSKENDQNFEDYIRKNELPKGYKKGTELTGKYTKETNEYLNQLTSKLQKLDKKDTKEIDKLNSKYKDKVNGKQQKKVEKFLKDKDIETKAFEK